MYVDNFIFPICQYVVAQVNCDSAAGWNQQMSVRGTH